MGKGLSSGGGRRFRLAENFANAEEGGVGNGDAQRVLAAGLDKTVFEMDVIAGVARQRGGDRNVDVRGAIVNFYAFTDKVSKRRHTYSLEELAESVNSTRRKLWKTQCSRMEQLADHAEFDAIAEGVNALGANTEAVTEMEFVAACVAFAGA